MMAKLTQEELNKIVEAHGKWHWSDGEEGQRADLQGAYLQGANLQGAYLQGAYLRRADLRRADLRRADLRKADLQGADLQGADLRKADLQGADLRRADLRKADLQGADLQGADLQGAYLDKTYYQIARIGSRNATTTFCVEDDNVICDCWNHYKGGTLTEFKERVENIYGEHGETPDKKYYRQYMAAIEFFGKMVELHNEKSERKKSKTVNA